MSYYRRGYNWEQIVYLPAPSAGWNPDANPWVLPTSESQLLSNLLIRPGKAVMRGPVQHWAHMGSPAATAGGVGGISVTGEPWWTMSDYDFNSGGYIEPARAVLQRGHGSGALLPCDPNATYANGTFNLGATTTGVLTNGIDAMPGARWIDFDGLYYGIAVDASSTFTDVNSNYVMKQLSLLSCPAVGHQPALMTDAPKGAFDLKGYLSRIWLLGGADTPGGSSAHSPTTLFFSNPIASGGGSAAADWQDPVSGLTNQIVMDRNLADYGVGLGTVRAGLVILRSNSLYLLRGTTTANFALIPISQEVGCVDARSIVEADAGVYFLSERGLMLTNGSEVKEVGVTVTRTLRHAIAQMQAALWQQQGAYAQMEMTADGQLMTIIGTWDPSTGVSTTTWSALFDPTTNAWTVISSALLSGSYPVRLLKRADGHGLVAIDASYMVLMEEPALGLSFCSPPTDAPNGLFDQGLSGFNGGNNYVPIPAQWISRFVPVVETTTLTRKYGQAKRYFVDFLFDATALGQSTGWQVTPVDATMTAIAPPLEVPINATGELIQRQDQDFVSEISDMSFNINWAPAAQSVPATDVTAEIYGVGIEYQPTRDL